MLATDKDTSRLLWRPAQRGTKCPTCSTQEGPLCTASSWEKPVTIHARLEGLQFARTSGRFTTEETVWDYPGAGRGTGRETLAPPVRSGAPGTPRSSPDPRAGIAASSIAPYLWCSLDRIKTGLQPAPPCLYHLLFRIKGPNAPLFSLWCPVLLPKHLGDFFKQMPPPFPRAALTLLHTGDTVPLSPSKSSFAWCELLPCQRTGKPASLSRLPACPFVVSGLFFFLR